MEKHVVFYIHYNINRVRSYCLTIPDYCCSPLSLMWSLFTSHVFYQSCVIFKDIAKVGIDSIVFTSNSGSILFVAMVIDQ